MTRTFISRVTAALSVAAALGTPGLLGAQPDTDAVRAAVQAFADGAAKQDAALLERALHPAAIQFIQGKEISSVDRPAYLAAIKERKMGGLPMTVVIQRLQVDGATAQAQATFSAQPFTLSHSLSLVKAEGRWQIISTVVRMIPK